MRFIKDYLVPFAISFIVAFFIVNYVIQLNIVAGNSMVPTMNDRDYVLNEKVSYYFNDPEIGDIVLVNTEEGILVKRIVAKGSGVVEFKKNEQDKGEIYYDLYFNGVKIEENYIKEPMSVVIQEQYTLKEGEYFVLGDNRNRSSDSRDFGPITKKDIIGHVFFNINQMRFY